VKDVEGFTLSDEVPEADAVEQHQSADFDDDADLGTPLLSATDRDANEADLIEQAYVVPVPDDDREVGY
jgi:hypothetical protein